MGGPDAYPHGDIQLIPGSHIAEIIKDPVRFGFSPEQVINAYNKHNERLGIEGKARRELIIDALELGWVRLRRYQNYYSATVHRLDDCTRGNLGRWALSVLEGPRGGYLEDDHHAEVRIAIAEGEKMVVLSLSELLLVPTSAVRQ